MTRDQLLIERAREGSREALADLFDRYWPHAWQTAYRILGDRSAADDVSQDAVMKGFQELQSFRGESSFKTWLTRIVINTATDALRRDARRSLGEVVVSEHDFGTTDRDSGEDVRRAVSSLPDAQRIPLVLRYWVDLGPREIADVLEIPLGTVHSRLARALQALRTALEVPDAR